MNSWKQTATVGVAGSMVGRSGWATYRIALIGDSVHARDTGLLQADQGADVFLLLAPVVPGGFLHSIGIDLVLLLGGRQASKGDEAEGECRTHGGDCVWVWSGCRRKSERVIYHREWRAIACCQDHPGMHSRFVWEQTRRFELQGDSKSEGALLGNMYGKKQKMLKS